MAGKIKQETQSGAQQAQGAGQTTSCSTSSALSHQVLVLLVQAKPQKISPMVV